MAKMIPSKPFETESLGEVNVFNAFKEQLPNDYTVLHSLRWVGSTRRRSQGEADFVVFHPQKGILVIEVKGGIILLDNNRRWHQTNRKTGIEREIFDPEKQASESKFKLIEVLNGKDCLVCHSVWFPDITIDKQRVFQHFPINYHPQMLLDLNDLKHVEASISTAFSYWETQMNRRTRLSQTESKNIIDILAPTLNLLPSLSIDYQNRERQFVQLTKEQTKILDFLELQNVAAIAGSAGTGKTFIAIEKARRLQEDGAKVLFLCYNRLLADFLQNNYSHYGVTISTFDALAVKYVGIKNNDFEMCRNDFQDYLMDDKNEFDFTDIIIDEGQDFENDWIEYLEYRIEKDRHFYVFYDQKQTIFKEEMNKWLRDAPCRLTLFMNCRNTEHIAKTSYGSLGKTGGKEPNLSGVKGEKPELISIKAPKQLAHWIDKTVNGFIQSTKTDLSNVALLTMTTMRESILSEVSSYSKLKYLDYKIQGSVCATTAKKFKGLEADLVVICDLDWNKMDDAAYRKLFYTACSRAKHKLYIVSPAIEDIDINFVLEQLTDKDSKRKLRGKIRFFKQFNLKNK